MSENLDCPYPIGSTEFHIWQAGYRAGYKSERGMWQFFTGRKYPQDCKRVSEWTAQDHGIHPEDCRGCHRDDAPLHRYEQGVDR